MSSATRAQQTAEQLRQTIRDGYYTCGERLVESKIAQEIGCSQNTVRDALRQLEGEGWVHYRARHGVSVRSFTADETEEIFALWGTLERLAFAWTMETHSRVTLLNALRPRVERAHIHINEGRWTAARQCLFEFHAVIAEHSGHARTIATLAQLRNQAYLIDTDYHVHISAPADMRYERIQAYDKLLGVLKFGTLDKVKDALEHRIHDLGKPLIKWIAMHE